MKINWLLITIDFLIIQSVFTFLGGPHFFIVAESLAALSLAVSEEEGITANELSDLAK